MAKRLTPQAARARLELIAPDAALALGDIIDFFSEVLTSDETVTVGDGDDAKEVPKYSFREKTAAAKEVRAAAPLVLDRGGAPPLRQVQVDAVHRKLEGKDERALLAEVAQMFLKLDPEDKELLAQMNPAVKGLLEAGDDDEPQRPH